MMKKNNSTIKNVVVQILDGYIGRFSAERVMVIVHDNGAQCFLTGFLKNNILTLRYGGKDRKFAKISPPDKSGCYHVKVKYNGYQQNKR